MAPNSKGQRGLSSAPKEPRPLQYSQTRASSNGPEVIPIEFDVNRQQGPEVVSEADGKEVVFGPIFASELQVPHLEHPELQVAPLEHSSSAEPSLMPMPLIDENETTLRPKSASETMAEDLAPQNRRTLRGRLSRRMITISIIAAFLAIGLVTGVAVLEKRKANGGLPSIVPTTSSTMSSAITSTATPKTSSASTPALPSSSLTGTFEGVRTSLMYPNNNADLFWLFYQDLAGGIRYVAYNNFGNWEQSQSVAIEDILNGSAITSISYWIPSNNTSFRRFFYVDSSRTLRDMILIGPRGQSTSAINWVSGNLGDYNFKAGTGISTGMAVAPTNGSFGIDRSGGDTPNLGADGGVSLYVGGEDGLLHEYNYFLQNDTWNIGFVFPGTNGQGGVSCGSGGYWFYIHIMSTESTLGRWWRIMNLKQVANPPGVTTPQGTWNRGTDLPITTATNSSISGSTVVVYQNSDLSIASIQVKNNTMDAAWLSPISVDNITSFQGSAIARGFLASGNQQSAYEHAFFQTNTSSIVMYGLPNETWIYMGEVPLS